MEDNFKSLDICRTTPGELKAISKFWKDRVHLHRRHRGPYSCVCAHLTLCWALISTSGIFLAHVSETPPENRIEQENGGHQLYYFLCGILLFLLHRALPLCQHKNRIVRKPPYASRLAESSISLAQLRPGLYLYFAKQVLCMHGNYVLHWLILELQPIKTLELNSLGWARVG